MKVVILQIQQQHSSMARFVFLVLLLAVQAATTVAPPPPQIAKAGCNDKCGDTSVPYPFGIYEPRCSMNDAFELECLYTDQYKNEDGDDKNKKMRLWRGNFEIANISVENGKATTYLFTAYQCYNNSNPEDPLNVISSLNLTGAAFTISSNENKFTAMGCDTQAFMGHGTRFSRGCMSLCDHPVNLTNKEDGGCSGVGCCRAQIPNGVKSIGITLDSIYNFLYVKNFSRCSVAFLADQNWSDFNSINLMDTDSVDKYMPPAVLDWVVGNDTCESFNDHSNKSHYACGDKTNCSNSYNGLGYLCSCKSGYQGNPYLLPQGCQDTNVRGDAKIRWGATHATARLASSVMEKLIAKVLALKPQRRNKARNLRKNGGTLLKHQDIKIYKEEELKKATRNYDDTQLLGQGASGSVYKGVLPDNSLVAIKKPNVDTDTRRIRPFRSRDEMNKEFQHEISMICKVSHTNVVKLKGLCLETKVPLLVYEFISNGSLFDHIHTACSTILNSWKTRLRIAFETALALDYLHSKAGTPIIHRDVKSMNILLDQNFTVKVADFGSSVLIPLEQGILQTKVLGTHGYLDPEYLITGILTIKSDVYSFGVVLMELLTSQMPISNQRFSEKVNFIPYFISAVEKGNLGDVLNVGGFDDRDKEMEQVEVVAELVVRCLNRSGVFRPDMNEVAESLLRLMKLNDNNGGVGDQSNIEEMQSLLSYHNDAQMVSSSSETQYMTSLNIQQTPSSWSL
ncbi:hypothetical protein LguiB_028237 [Lonicera macranthoides]